MRALDSIGAIKEASDDFERRKRLAIQVMDVFDGAHDLLQPPRKLTAEEIEYVLDMMPMLTKRQLALSRKGLESREGTGELLPDEEIQFGLDDLFVPLWEYLPEGVVQVMVDESILKFQMEEERRGVSFEVNRPGAMEKELSTLASWTMRDIDAWAARECNAGDSPVYLKYF